MKSQTAILAVMLYTVVARTMAAAPALTVPPGFSIELAAGPPLVERPIVASFDDEGRLYVAESSGSNDPVEQQLAQLPHRIVRLDDADGDGKFDRRTVFADRMMFPEGALFFDGSLYVSAPPSIWKLTDTNDDGVADQRVEWFQGKTLTGCANDLHGPYLGPDGWIYWCKGAFAEQTHSVNGREWTTRAAHIFRCRPDGSGFEPVMTGGMDNPVDVVFTPEGERIFSATYFVGGGGRRDGLAHAIYGGVYGKDHGVLAGHARTGDLMPALVLMSPAAPCGLERYDSHVFGSEYNNNLFLCQFNLRKVSRHVLQPAGSSYLSEDSDFVVSEDVDFHPTDVLVDADGSLLIVDTGGWYKLCCPTSQLWKPDVLGGIYRVRRSGATVPADPRGRQIDFVALDAEQLWAHLADERPAVRQRASRELVRRRETPALQEFVARQASLGKRALDAPRASQDAKTVDDRTVALARLWTISQVQSDASRELVRQLISHDDESIRQAALHVVSLHRDSAAAPAAMALLSQESAANRRVAAEALGRLGNSAAVAPLLAAAATAEDRILQHSIIYALIELADPTATRAGLVSDQPGTKSAALLALDQMPGGGVEPAQVIPLLNAEHDGLRQAARWLVSQHAEWGADLADWFRAQLAKVAVESDPASSQATSGTMSEVLEPMLVTFAGHPSIQKLLAETAVAPESSLAARRVALRVMAAAKLDESPQDWRAALAAVVVKGQRELLGLTIEAARALPPMDAPDSLDEALIGVAESPAQSAEQCVSALAVVAAGMRQLPEPLFQLLVENLALDKPVALRSAAADALSRAHLSPAQLGSLCLTVESAGPLELNRLLAPFAQSTDTAVAQKLLKSLTKANSLSSLRMDLLRQSLAGQNASLQPEIDKLESLVNVDAAAQRQRLEDLLPLMATGDIRRGHAVYYSSKAACSACHQLGHAGGKSGPELTHIGETRTVRDLLESILFPSLSFVRSYEPVLVITAEGRTINATITDETAQEYLLTTGPDQQVRVRREEVEEVHPSTVSIMPAGLDKQLTTQELADLVAFLKDTAGR